MADGSFTYELLQVWTGAVMTKQDCTTSTIEVLVCK
jgi:hypothetical protein